MKDEPSDLALEAHDRSSDITTHTRVWGRLGLDFMISFTDVTQPEHLHHGHLHPLAPYARTGVRAVQV